MVHAFYLSTWEAKAGGSEFEGSLQIDFQDSQSYNRENPVSENKSLPVYIFLTHWVQAVLLYPYGYRVVHWA